MTAAMARLLLKSIRDANLVAADALARLEALADAGADATALVREVRRLKLLTDFQIKEIAKGRGAALTLGPYVLTELLGEGGMGRVYRATHTRLSREVALKVIRPEKLAKESSAQRFRQEIRATAQLSHPNVVVAYDADRLGDTHYYSMECVEGVDLARLVQSGGPMTVEGACDAVVQACAGLEHAHGAGLVHRDIKPSNLMRTPRGLVKLLDLGLARLVEAESDPFDSAFQRVTTPGTVLGTPDYLSPEQAQNPQDADARADVYSLGATLYYLLAGKPPFDGPTPTDKLVQHVTAPPPSVCAVRPDVPPGLDLVIQTMLAKAPGDRPQSAAEAAEMLRPFAGSPRSSSVLPALAPEPAGVEEPGSGELAGLTLPAAPRAAPARRRRPDRSQRLGGLIGFAVACALFGYVFWDNFPGAGRGPVQPTAAEYKNAQGMTFRLLPAGRYRRGASADQPGALPNEGPATEAEIPEAFYCGTTEVTHGQYRKVVGSSPSRMAPRMRKPADTPVDSATWDEAVEFCRLLDAKDAAKPAGFRYRLPTEVEWEYACRAGSATPFGCGERLVFGSRAVFDLDRSGPQFGEEDPTRGKMERGLPYPAGQTSANAWGLRDLHGNVAEWCADTYADTLTDTTDPRSDRRPARGGSWRDPAERCRSAARAGLARDERRDDVGFRVVLATE